MLERLLRSPFFYVGTVILLGTLFVVEQEELFPFYYIIFAFLLFVAFYFVLVVYNNKKFPDNRINLDTYSPAEFREEDEGLQWVTFKACRKVYLFYYFGIPVGISLVAVYHNSVPLFGVWVLVLFGIIQNFIFWFEIRKIKEIERRNR